MAVGVAVEPPLAKKANAKTADGKLTILAEKFDQDKSKCGNKKNTFNTSHHQLYTNGSKEWQSPNSIGTKQG